MDIAQEFAKRKAQLEQELKFLQENDLQVLLDEKAALEIKLAEADRKIAQACAVIGLDLSDHSKKTETKRTRMSPAELRERVLKVLTESKQGLGQTEIAEKSGAPYQSVVVFLKENADGIRSEGTHKAKRFFLNQIDRQLPTTP